VTTLLAIWLGLLGAVPAWAAEEPAGEDDEYHLFSGGLLFHLTPLPIEGIEDVAIGPALGLGGGMVFRIGPYLRVGGMGGSAALTFGDHDSVYRSSMGGLTVAGAIPLGPVEINLGLLFGGRSMTVFHFMEAFDDGTYRVDRIQRSGVILLPMAGVTIRISRKVAIPLFVQYQHPDFLDGFIGHAVTIHIGPWFNTYVPYPPPASGLRPSPGGMTDPEALYRW